MSTTHRGTLSFPALRGRMGSREYYVVLLPLSVVPRLLPAPENAELPPEARAQRKLIAKRVPEIARYILQHEEDWLFSSLTASFPDGSDTFAPNSDDPNVGMLHFPLDVSLLINDGQHRRAAIEAALREDSTLGHQTVSVVLFPGEDVERNQQMFSDLNRTVQKTSRSLDIMYDHRDPLNQITLSVAERVPLLRQRVDKEALSLAVRSAKLVTLSALYDSLQQLLGDLPEGTKEGPLQKGEERAVDFWLRLTSAIPQYQAVVSEELSASHLRMEFITGHSVFMYAIGGVGKRLAEANELDRLGELGTVDFRRTNPEWQGICMLGTDIITRRQTRFALREMLLFKLGSVPEPPAKVL